jgi:hypothetical protein
MASQAAAFSLEAHRPARLNHVMAAHAQHSPLAVRAKLLYLQPGVERPFNRIGPPDGGPMENCAYEACTVSIANARQALFSPSLTASGFTLCDAPTAVRDFHDADEVERVYHGELREIALEATGGRRAIVFDRLLRRREPGRPEMTLGQRAPGGLPGAAGRVHNDYSEASGRARLAKVLGQRDAAFQAGRWCIVNVWRSARGTVLDTPLALCDARSVGRDDLVPVELRYPGRTGEIYQLRHNAAHRWSYFDALRPHEVIVFKQYDTERSVARFTPHAAFDHPGTPPDAPLRESIEARILVLY